MARFIKVPILTELLGRWTLFMIVICLIERNSLFSMITHFLWLRFSVAIKSTKSLSTPKLLTGQSFDFNLKENEENDVSNDPDLELLMDEAKTMYSIGGYHENIINLQGISYTPDFKTGNLRQVSVNYGKAFRNAKGIYQMYITVYHQYNCSYNFHIYA